MKNDKGKQAGQRAVKDLTAKNTTQVKGGKIQMQPLQIVKQVDKATP